ncbi:hypothetical protein LX36DRAFT_388576 [Colletotrichum falcatum]|nr:hypothetical protein LX36DRAFT_388576 [Colletotrichum falcatum]
MTKRTGIRLRIQIPDRCIDTGDDEDRKLTGADLVEINNNCIVKYVTLCADLFSVCVCICRGRRRGSSQPCFCGAKPIHANTSAGRHPVAMVASARDMNHMKVSQRREGSMYQPDHGVLPLQSRTRLRLEVLSSFRYLGIATHRPSAAP